MNKTHKKIILDFFVGFTKSDEILYYRSYLKGAPLSFLEATFALI